MSVDRVARNAMLFGLMAIGLWSTLPVISIITAEVPLFLSLIVVYLAALVFNISYWKVRYGSVSAKLKQPIGYVIIYSLGLFCSNATFLGAMRYGDPILSYLACNLWPIFALFFAAIFFKEKLRSFHYLSALMGFTGVIFIATKDGALSAKNVEFFGLMIGLINAVVWGFVIVMYRQFSSVSADSIGVPICAALVMAIVAHVSFEEWKWLSISHVLALLYLGVLPWCIAHMLWSYALKIGDIKKMTLLGYTRPLLGVMWMVLLGEAKFNTSVFIAMVLIILSALLGSMGMFLKARSTMLTVKD